MTARPTNQLPRANPPRLSNLSRAVKRKDALRYACDLEQGVLERDFFAVLEADTPQMRDTFEFLRDQTAQHLARLQEKAGKKG